MSRPRRDSLLLLIAALALLPVLVNAEPLVVGFQGLDIYPYGRLDENGQYVGYMRALLDAFAADQGYELQMAAMPLKRFYLEIQGNRVDLFVPDNPGWSQEAKAGVDIHYSVPIAVALDGFAVLADAKNKGIGDGIRTIGVPLGITVEPLFDAEALAQIEFQRAARWTSVFRALRLGRVDAVYCNRSVAAQVLSAIDMPTQSIAWNTRLPRFKSEFHVSSERQELIAQLNAWMNAKADVVEALKKEYGIWADEKVAWGD